ncbi:MULTISPECIES: hypothetical protein [unclassified Fusibacter]|uniref:hypothetical protein n=1 Tax=unclassified Fusibacter TaxID=2624464 RepID=UPI001010310B|nr:MULTISPECIES: hypothetical protein [unclassified Fusibacter]MCK8060757.1 hypothetical protein [Fusibacter sp. A2]NPE23053.1 hypothetical protein [Fusibacter sp. A1]RXV59725.1 hypothetical protein DWB64_14520 [Fusibacter sp. A1]
MPLTIEQKKILMLRRRIFSRPSKTIQALKDKFSSPLMNVIQEGDSFFLARIEHFSEQSAACICGRSVKHLYIIRHVDKELELGLGSECVKHFFESASADKLEEDLKKFDEFCHQVEEALDKGVLEEQLLLLDVYKNKKNGFLKNEIERLNYGLPLTEPEYRRLVERINRDTVAIERTLDTLIKPYESFATLEDRQYILGVLEDGYQIRTAEDLKDFSLGDLAASIRPYMKQRTRESFDQKTICQIEASVVEKEVDYLLVADVITGIQVIKEQVDRLSATAKVEFDNLIKDLEDLKELDSKLYLEMLVHKETRVVLQADLNQLKIKMNLYK